MRDLTVITQMGSAESQLDGDLLLYLMGLPLSRYPPPLLWTEFHS